MWSARPFASLAQLVEHVICNLGVVGSSPTRGSLTRLVLETISTIDEQIAKLSSLLVFSYSDQTTSERLLHKGESLCCFRDSAPVTSGETRRRVVTIIQTRLHIDTVRCRGGSDFHLDISKYPGGEFLFSTWGRKNSSEESNETSEEMNHAHVENKKYPRGDLRFPTWIFEKRD